MRSRFRDKAPPRFYTTEQLGPKRALTPEGFLVCYDVPLARVGVQDYHISELADAEMDPGPGGVVHVERRAEDVFDPDSVASWSGKPVVIRHPRASSDESEFDVTPDNHREVAVGHIMHPRRGEGRDADVLLVDFMITDACGIDVILRDELNEVSGGYVADYEQIAPGRGRQKKIIGNHGALVDAGRCGSRCAIGDEDMHFRDDAGRQPSRLMRALSNALGTRDKKRLTRALDELREELPQTGEPAGDDLENEAGGGGGAGATHVHVHLPEGADKGTAAGDEGPEGAPPWFKEYHKGLDARFGKIEDALGKIANPGGEEGSEEHEEAESHEEEAAPMGDEEIEGELEEEDPEPAATGDRSRDRARARDHRRPPARRAAARVASRDSSHLEQRHRDAVSRAEILCPGIAVPAFVKTQDAVATVRDLCGFRRRALGRAYGTEEGRAAIDAVIGSGIKFGDALPRMSCDSVMATFNGAAEIARGAANSRQSGYRAARDHGTERKGEIKTLRELNDRNKKAWNIA